MCILTNILWVTCQDGVGRKKTENCPTKTVFSRRHHLYRQIKIDGAERDAFDFPAALHNWKTCKDRRLYEISYFKISNSIGSIPDKSEMGSGCNSCPAKSLQFFQLNQMHPFSSIKTGGCQQLTFTEGQHVLIVLSFSVCILS